MSKHKVCICCKHFYFDAGDPGYSDWTPGTDWYMHCDRGLWHMSGYNISTKTYRETLLKANNCNSYEEDWRDT